MRKNFDYLHYDLCEIPKNIDDVHPIHPMVCSLQAKEPFHAIPESVTAVFSSINRVSEGLTTPISTTETILNIKQAILVQRQLRLKRAAPATRLLRRCQRITCFFIGDSQLLRY